MPGSGLTAFLQNLGGGEIVVIVLVALVVLGPDRIPEMARGAGRLIHKAKTMGGGLTSEVKQVMDDPAMQPLRELGELAARPRQKLAEYALEAEAEARAAKERESLAAAEKQAADDTAPAEDTPPADDTAPAGTPDPEAQAPDRAEPPAPEPGAEPEASDAADPEPAGSTAVPEPDSA